MSRSKKFQHFQFGFSNYLEISKIRNPLLQIVFPYYNCKSIGIVVGMVIGIAVSIVHDIVFGIVNGIVIGIVGSLVGWMDGCLVSRLV